MFSTGEIEKLLQSFVNDTLDIQGVILTNSQQNSAICLWAEEEDKAQEKEILADLLPLTDHLPQNLILGTVERITLEGKVGYCVVVACKNNSILLVWAKKQIIKGWLFLNIKKLVKNLNNLYPSMSEQKKK